MLFVARAAIKLRDDFLNQRHDEWNDIKTVGTIEYKWRLCEDLTYEVTAGFFEKYDEALACAKQIYVSLLYYALRNDICIKNAGCQSYNPNLFVEGLDGDRDAFLENEEFFLWKNKNGGNYGPSVIEVEKDYEELSMHQIIPLDVSIEWQSMDLAIEDIDKYVFSYTREAQRLLSIVVLADQTSSIGMKMTMYCALLEHLSPNRKKNQCTLNVIDEMIRVVEKSSLSDDDKTTLINYLNDGRNVSARQKCLIVAEYYAKEEYEKHKCKQIISEAYSIRSAFSHGDDCENLKVKCAYLIKYIVLDIIQNYLREKEKAKTPKSLQAEFDK